MLGSRDEVAAPQLAGRRTATIAAVLALVAAITLGAAWLIVGGRGGVDLVAVEATSTELVAELAAAETTAAVRAVAAEAAAQADEVQPMLSDGSDPEDTAARSYVLLWEQVAGLADLSGATLDIWETLRGGLTGALADVAEDGRAEIAAAGTEAVESMDTLVAGAREALQNWELERDAALAARDRNAERVTAVAEYRGAVLAQLALYEDLRDRTTAHVQPLYDPAVATEDVWNVMRNLQEGAADREQIAAVISALVPPPGLDGEHTSVLRLLQDAVQAMREGIAGVDSALSVRYTLWEYLPDAPIDIRAQPQWQEFSAASSRLDQALPQAQQALEAAAAALIVEYEQAVVVPPRPVV